MALSYVGGLAGSDLPATINQTLAAMRHLTNTPST
jgi:hypothetical protein